MQHKKNIVLVLLCFFTLSISSQTNRVGIGTSNPLAGLHIEVPEDQDAFRVRIDGSTKFWAHGNGNIAIGSFIPLEKLHVRGNLLLQNSPDVNLRFLTSSSFSSRLQFFETGDLGFEFHYDGSADKLYMNSKGFIDNEGTLMTWLKDGNVGIGTTTPLEPLHVAGNILSTGVLRVRDGIQDASLVTNASEGYIKLDVGGTGHSGDHIVLGESGGGTPNNVGIGTTSPDTRLHIVGSDNNGATATLKVSSGTQSLLLDGNEIDAVTSDLLLQHNNPNDVVMATGGGNVGIGTTAPEFPLHIQSPGTSGQTIAMVIESAVAKRPVILFSEVSSNHTLANGMSLEYDGSGGGSNGNKFRINKAGGNPALTVENGGEVGINLVAPSAALHIIQTNDDDNGGLKLEHPSNTNHWELLTGSTSNLWFKYNGTLKSFIKLTDGTFNQGSDIRLKQDITPMPAVLEKVNQLKPSFYRYKTHPNAEKSLGFIAQEVEKLFPEVVSENKGYKAINYDAFAVIAIQALKEQQVIIDQHEVKIELLQKEMAEIKKLLSTHAALNSPNR